MYKLAELAEQLDAEVIGDVSIVVTGIATLANANGKQLSFFDNPKYRADLQKTNAAAVILSEQDKDDCPATCLVVTNPYAAYAKAVALFADCPEQEPGIHATAVIEAGAEIAGTARIGAYAVIRSNVKIDDNVSIGPHCIIGENCQIGANTRLWPNVTLYYGSQLGTDCEIHSGVVIGSDGFGLAKEQGVWHKVHQIGAVLIGNNVEIGANTTIDRGALNNTVLEDGVKLDNQIQIAHNVRIGAHTAIAGCSAVAGSTTIGKHCIVAGGVCIAGHLNIADNVSITGMSMVTNSVNAPGVYSSGSGGLQTNRDWRRSIVRIRQLDKLHDDIRELNNRLAILEESYE